MLTEEERAFFLAIMERDTRQGTSRRWNRHRILPATQDARYELQGAIKPKGPEQTLYGPPVRSEFRGPSLKTGKSAGIGLFDLIRRFVAFKECLSGQQGSECDVDGKPTRGRGQQDERRRCQGQEGYSATNDYSYFDLPQ